MDEYRGWDYIPFGGNILLRDYVFVNDLFEVDKASETSLQGETAFYLNPYQLFPSQLVY